MENAWHVKDYKKSWISYITLENLQPIIKMGPKTPTWNAIRLTCKRRHIDMSMSICRKVFASWLIQSGIDANSVDLLQGRVPQSVLARHYQSPSDSLKDDVLKALEKLQSQL